MNTSPAAVQNRCTASDFLSKSSGSSRAIPLIVSVMATPSNAIQRAAPAYPERRAFYRDVLAAQPRLARNPEMPVPAWDWYQDDFSARQIGWNGLDDRSPRPAPTARGTGFECKVLPQYPVGDHVLVLGKVMGGKLLDSETESISYRPTDDMDGASALFPDGFRD